jgi:1,4-alpha-glucan branching enzyme
VDREAIVRCHHQGARRERVRRDERHHEAMPHHEWDDAEWLERRRGAEHVSAPVSIYEVHLGSWRLNPG